MDYITITHAKDTTLQIGNDKDITEYRYRGASPKNYVTFNNETWRIIGIFPTDDGTGNIENRIKLIKDQSIGNKKWNESGNNWTEATLNTELNTTYLTGLSIEVQNMIGNAKYYLGGHHDIPDLQKDVMYKYERKIDNSSCAGGDNCHYVARNPNNLVSKIGLMYVSDYGYAASDVCTSNLYAYSSSTCTSNNWLFKSYNEWTLPQLAYDFDDTVFYIISAGGVDGGTVTDQYGVRPVLYLISSVQITGGDGTSSSPYTFGL